MDTSELTIEHYLSLDDIDCIFKLLNLNDNFLFTDIHEFIKRINTLLREINNQINLEKLNTNYSSKETQLFIERTRKQFPIILKNYFPIAYSYYRNNNYSRKDYLDYLSVDYSDIDKNLLTICSVTSLSRKIIGSKCKDITRLNFNYYKYFYYFKPDNNQINFIKYFPNLTYLCLNINDLCSIDLTHNYKLKTLEMHDNQLTEIDLSKNTLLKKLILYGNLISDIDLSHNTLLTHLDLSDNKLTEIDLSNNEKLDYIDLSSNELTEINLSNNEKLKYIDLSDNKLPEIDLSKNSHLVTRNTDDCAKIIQ